MTTTVIRKPIDWAAYEADMRKRCEVQTFIGRRTRPNTYLLVSTDLSPEPESVNYAWYEPEFEAEKIAGKHSVEITFLPDGVSLVDGSKTYNMPDLERAMGAWIDDGGVRAA